jgi:phospholipase/carboxylesterase
MPVATLSYESINPGDAKRCIIWLHGLGADGFNFMPLVPQLGLQQTEYIFPHAPVRPITINAGMSMRAWFDIYALDRLDREDEEGMMASRESIKVLIEEALARGYESRSIFLVGFSQGGVLTLLTGLTFDRPLGGLLALSCYMPMAAKLLSSDMIANRDVPIFMAHGYQDDILPFRIGDESAKGLKAAGYDVSWHPYPMQHNICDAELKEMKAFIEKHSR